MSTEKPKQMKDTAAVHDEVAQTLTIDLSPPKYSLVKVISENGIFKQGKQYDLGDEVVLESRGANGLVNSGDVEVLEENVPAPEDEGQDG